ncbi:MAG: TIGR00725 family protein [Actinobacteria bacterium]|nr:TIGR00725 family protein [Actinomycetota bacterium]
MRTIIGVMGSGRPLDGADHKRALELGRLVAEHGWVLLTGGTASGVMDAVSQGAREAGGLVVGVLKSDDGAECSQYVDVAIRTGMGDARNAINVLSSDLVIALPGGSGTLSEVALALKAGRTVIVLGWDPGAAMRASEPGKLLDAASPEEAVTLAAGYLNRLHH